MDIAASLIKLIFGSKADKDRKQIEPYLEKIKAVYPAIEALSNDELRARSEALKKQIADFIAADEARIVELKAKLELAETSLEEKEKVSKEIDETTKRIDEKIEEKLDEILPEAFAIMKDTARRFAQNETVVVTANDFDRDLAAAKDFVTIEGDKAVYANHWMAGGNDVKWDMIHYDVQLFGGVVLHKGKIAEMATGEGKTLVATLPVFLNALAKKGVHLVTVNNYLAKRDSEWMGMLFQFGALFTDLSVFDNVAFPMREQTDLDEETIRDLVLMKLNAVGLRGAAHLMPSEISGGMARRVALARAIALDPALIMYDEPFAGLDPISLGVTANLIRKLNDALHSTSVIVTHDVVETFEIADYVYMINAGRVAAEGSPEELCRSEEPFVKQFINALPDGPVRFHYPANSIEACFGGEER